MNDTVEIQHNFAPADAWSLVGATSNERSAKIGQDVGKMLQQPRPTAGDLWELRIGTHIIEPHLIEVVSGDGDVEVKVRFEHINQGAELEFVARVFARLQPTHRIFVVLKDAEGKDRAEWLLKREIPGFKFSLAAPPRQSKFGSFFVLGIEHILTGYDHLLFLFGLLIVCRNFGEVVRIVTCFTLAHSLTLACATLGLVQVSAKFVEPMIAASIVFIGAENLWLRGRQPRGRSYITFVFGLVHGFGFASVLRDLGVGSNGGDIALPLFSFNIGVEFGQILIACIALPVIWRLRVNPAFEKRGVPLISSVVVLFGAYWLIERIAFAG